MTFELQDIGLAIKQLQHRHHRAADARLAPLGITLVQWDALRAISRNPGASAHKLALLTFQTDQSFGTLAGRMLAHGLIQRTVGPGRAIQHHLTSSGEALLGAGYALVNEIVMKSFSPLTPHELDTLYDLLTRVLEGPGKTLTE